MGIAIFKIFILVGRGGGYMVGYTFGNYVLRLRSRVAVKRNFRLHIRRYTSPNENFDPLNRCNQKLHTIYNGPVNCCSTYAPSYNNVHGTAVYYTAQQKLSTGFNLMPHFERT